MERIAAKGGTLPPWYLEPPTAVDPTIEEFYIKAWSFLDRERAMGANAPGPIPASSMVWYAERAGLEGPDVEDFCTILATMDDDHLRQVMDDIKAASKTPPPSGPRHRSRK